MTLSDKIAALREHGYRIGIAADMLADTQQSRAENYPGEYLIDDPQDNEDGFCLRGNNLSALVDEAYSDRLEDLT